MPASFEIDVADLGSVLELYDRIQIWKSLDGTPTGAYAEITADSPQAAFLDAANSGPYAISGQTLSITLNGADPIAVTFTGVNPIPLASVINQINLARPDLATLTTNNHLRLLSPLTGTGSAIVATGAAAITLGIPSMVAYGKGARPLMGLLNSIYRFTDLGGSSSDYYKTRYYSTITLGVGAFSDPFRGDLPVVVADTTLVKASITLVAADGSPVVGRRVMLVPVSQKIVSDVSGLFGMLPSADRLEMVTDGAGYAEIHLVIGSRLRAFFEGSGYSREFDVPGTDFDLLTTLSTQPDPFSIVQAPPMPIRES